MALFLIIHGQCSSGLQAFINIAGEIQSGMIPVGIAAGVESMSLTDMASSVPEVRRRKKRW